MNMKSTDQSTEEWIAQKKGENLILLKWYN